MAATAIARRLNVPGRGINVLEGENLINDGTALVLYRVAVGAVGGSFSLVEAGLQLVLGAIGGIAIGLAVGWVIAEVRKRLDDPPVEVTISLLSGYAAYVPAERAGASGVLAAVTLGIYVGWRAPEISSARMRVVGYSVWEILRFLLNALWADMQDDGAEEREELAARRRATAAALDRLDELAGEEWTRDDTVQRVRGQYEYRARRLGARAGETEDGDGYEHRSLGYQRMVRELLDAQRRAVVALRNEGTISNDVMHRIERELDLEDERLEI